MATTRLSTKGQLIIPKKIRKRHGWDAGTELAVDDEGDRVAVRPAAAGKRTKLRDLLGCLKWEGKPKTLEDMERAIESGALENR